jgi:succinate dehydrogenase / fumarate reductase cytochrome b subunit
MAVSGFFMVTFVVAHLLGNSTIFVGPDWINAYAEHLHELPLLVWPFRMFMFAMLCIHIFFGITLTLENWGANPGKYAVSKRPKSTFAGRTMIWTGLLLLAFLMFHLLHFTFKVAPEVVQVLDGEGRLDVFTMMVAGLLNIKISAVYIFAMIVLFLHTSHGIQSFIQTLGLNNEKTLPKFRAMATILALVFLLGFSAIPVLILTWIIS